jgi:uncharacterized protein (DUF169 family)
MTSEWHSVAQQLVALLALDVPPVGITFSTDAPADVDGYPEPMSDPTPDGRSGRAAASCVYWVEASASGFSTVAEDHGNCSVGRWVHGFARPEDILDKADVGALLGSGWVSREAVGGITAVADPAPVISYAPLGTTAMKPDVVVLRLTPDQMMQFGDACPSVDYSGKPQCQIIAKAKEHGTVTASMGCALSRQRTGMPATELTCAVPAALLPSIVDQLGQVVQADSAVRSYAVAND